MIPVIVALVGVALLIALAVGVAWQETRPASDGPIVYGVEESISYVQEHLSAEAASVLRAADVRRMLEWSVRYLQDPAVRDDPDTPAVAGGSDAAKYVQDRCVEAGIAYDAALVVEVLGLQNDYLRSLGALGATVDDSSGEPDSDG